MIFTVDLVDKYNGQGLEIRAIGVLPKLKDNAKIEDNRKKFNY